MQKPLDSRPVKAVLCSQAGLTLIAMTVGAVWAGVPGAISAMLGGGINMLANAGYACAMHWSARPRTAAATLITLFRAEAVKLALVSGLLVLALAFYRDIQPVVFFVTFFVTVLAFGVAFLQR